jgi:hypothetical protein
MTASPAALAAVRALASARRDALATVFLDDELRVLGGDVAPVSPGPGGAIGAMREALKGAIRADASAILVAYQRPTRGAAAYADACARFVEVGKLLGLPVLAVLLVDQAAKGTR